MIFREDVLRLAEAHAEAVRSLFQLGEERETYWIECDPETHSPPHAVVPAGRDAASVAESARRIVAAWRVLPEALRSDLIPVVERVVSLRDAWRVKKTASAASGRVSDHVYEM